MGTDLASISCSADESLVKSCHQGRGEKLFKDCIAQRQEFHVDPYGRMSFCSFIKDPALRYDLRQGSVRDAWEAFIPALAEKGLDDPEEYKRDCGSCDWIQDCDRCPAQGYLEHRRYSAKVEYLCGIAKENHEAKAEWARSHRRYFQLAGMTIQVDADLPFAAGTFGPVLSCFETAVPGDELLRVRHHFALPRIAERELGEEVYHVPPWKIFRKNGSWIYVSVPPLLSVADSPQIMVLNHEHSRAVTYQLNGEAFTLGGANALLQISSDQIILPHTLAFRNGFYIHSSGIRYESKGFLFVGHSEAGKSTMAEIFPGARGGTPL